MVLQDFTEEKELSSKGVYLITHNSTDIKYVGSTISAAGFAGRWRAHLNGLKRGVGNIVLLRICKKYGVEGFRFHILEIPDDVATIRKRERWWIEVLDTYRNGANCTLDTENGLKDFKRRPYTTEQILNYRKTSPSKKKVFLYDLDGKLVQTFQSTVECDRHFNLKKGRTDWIINHPLRSIKRLYYPTFEERKWVPREILKELLLARANKVASARKINGTYHISAETTKKIRLNNKTRHSVELYTLEGIFVKSFSSLNECDDYLELTRGTTSKVINGKAKTLKRKYIPRLI